MIERWGCDSRAQFPRPLPPQHAAAPLHVAHQHRRFPLTTGPRFGHGVVDVATVAPDQDALPLAHALPALFPARYPTITAARRACRRGEVLLNGAPAPVDAPLAVGDEVTATLRTAGAADPGPAPAGLVRAAQAAAAATALLSVAYEDDYLALVVKPPGLATQGAGRGVADVQSLLPALLAPSTAAGALWRPRPAHRPDAWVGGLVLVAKTRPALAALSEAIGSREVAWRYAGLVTGRLTGSGRVAAPLDGRAALTEWVALRTGRVRVGGAAPGAALTQLVTAVQLRALAGPPAQLRRHMALAGHPLVGDALGGGGGGGGRRGGPGRASPATTLGGTAVAAASAALFAAKRVARGGARRLGRGDDEYDDDDSRNSASTARARFGRADGGGGTGRLAPPPPPAPSFSAAALPTPADAGIEPASTDDPWSALSGTTAVDRLRADAAADARAAAREAAAEAAGGENRSVSAPVATAAVPAPSLGRGWATRRGPAVQPSPPAETEMAVAGGTHVPASPWAVSCTSEPALAPRPAPPPPPAAASPSPRASAAEAAAYLAVDFDPPPLVVAGGAGGGGGGSSGGGSRHTHLPAGVLAMPTPTLATPTAAAAAAASRAGVPVCLWAVHVSLTHPETGELLTVAIPPPADLAAMKF